MNLIKNIYFMLYILMIIQSNNLVSSLKFKERDPVFSTYNDLVVSFFNNEKGDFIKVDSQYDLILSDALGRDTLIFEGCMIHRRLYLPETVCRVLVCNSIIEGGIQFASGKGVVEKRGSVILGPVQGGVVE